MYSADVKFFASSFSVPAKIADEMLKLCSGEQLKVILCILRNPGVTDEEISAKTGVGLEDVLECTEFWTDCGIIKSDKTETAVIASEKDNVEMAEKVISPTVIPLPKPTQHEIDAALKKSRSLRNLFNEAQQILGSTYGFTMQSTLYNIVFYYGLSQDVANLLLTFAKYADVTAQQDLLKIAKYWSDNGITDCAAASEYIDKAEKSRKMYKKLCEITGNADSNPTFIQYDYLNKWIAWGFKAEAVAKAHEIMKAEKETGKLNYRNFQFMDKVLRKWHEAGAHTVGQIEKLSSAPVVKKPSNSKPKKETSFDIEKAKEQSRDRTRDIGNMKNKKKKRRA